AILACVELLGGGRNLPFQPAGRTEPTGVLALGSASVQLHVLTVLHCLLFTTLIALALIDQDGQPPPVGLVALPLGLFVIALLFWQRWVPGSVVIGLAAGAFFGFVLGALYEPARWSRVPATTAGLALVGAFLGWEAALVATAGGLVVFAVMLLAAPAR